MSYTVENIKEIYGILEDDESRSVFCDRLLYAVTGDVIHLLRMIEMEANKHGILKETPNYGLVQLSKNLLDIEETVRLAIWGTASASVTVIQLLYEYGILEKKNIEVFFVDNDIEKQNKVYEHHNDIMKKMIYSPDVLKKDLDHTYLIVGVNNRESVQEIVTQALKMGIDVSHITYGTFCFEYGIGNIYLEEGIMRPKAGQTFCDIGAYDMWNTKKFIEWNPNYEKVFAYEADPVSYKNCKEEVERMGERVSIQNLGIWSEKSSISFMSAPNGEYGGSRIDEAGELKVAAKPLDDLLGDEKVSIIKMDIEGAELHALKGAEMIIRKKNPELAISVYHKPLDIVELPLYIKSLNPEYKVYMRHHTWGIWDTVLYATLGE